MRNTQIITVVALLVAAAGVCPAEPPPTVVVVNPPDAQLRVFHHTRPFDGFTDAFQGGLIWGLLDKGVEKSRRAKDSRIAKKLLEMSGVSAPSDNLAHLIRTEVVHEDTIATLDSIEAEGPFKKAAKNFYSPPDQFAVDKKSVKRWRKANRFTDYTSLRSKGVRYVLEFNPQLLLESPSHKHPAGFMGIRAKINVIDLNERHIRTQRQITVGFSAGGGLQEIPLRKSLWEEESAASGPLTVGTAVATNLDVLWQQFAERIQDLSILDPVLASRSGGDPSHLAQSRDASDERLAHRSDRTREGGTSR